MALPGFTDIRCGTLQNHPSVGFVELARPLKFNAFNAAMWREFPAAVRAVEAIASVRAVLVFAEGRHFCTGIDIEFLKDTFLPFAQPPASRSEGLHDNGSSSGSRPGPNTPAPTPACPGLARESMRRGILGMQDAYSALERCRWPVIAAIHGAAMHLALTAQTVSAGEALRLGLVSRVVEGSGQEAVRSAGVALAAQMAAKPSLALLGTKRVLLHASKAAERPRAKM
ncbi:MAG: hypothetical protein WDW38_009367 [Sanguina aurantia]